MCLKIPMDHHPVFFPWRVRFFTSASFSCTALLFLRLLLWGAYGIFIGFPFSCLQWRHPFYPEISWISSIDYSEGQNYRGRLAEGDKKTEKEAFVAGIHFCPIKWWQRTKVPCWHFCRLWCLMTDMLTSQETLGTLHINSKRRDAVWH